MDILNILFFKVFVGFLRPKKRNKLKENEKPKTDNKNKKKEKVLQKNKLFLYIHRAIGFTCYLLAS